MNSGGAAPVRSPLRRALLERGGARMAGLFLVCLGILMLEILLTRLFSVTMWYHFAFATVSLAMLGMTAGAILVYLLPAVFRPQRLSLWLSLFSLLFGLGVLFAVGVHIGLRLPDEQRHMFVAITFTTIALPFTLGGVVVCLALTSAPSRIGRLYAADLCGAAVGCLLLLVLLDTLGDLFTVVVMIAALCALAAFFFALDDGPRPLQLGAGAAALILLLLASYMGYRVQQGRPLLRVTWTKGAEEKPAVYERWNSHSRIKLTGNPAGAGMVLVIDGAAATAMQRFDGDVARHAEMRREIANVVHVLRRPASVAIIGPGGGRDMLAAHLFGQPRVLGIEMNRDIVDLLTNRFADFTGRLADLPGYDVVNDEARSYLSRTDERFDIIMATLIDTWAATSAGAFVLTENSLYTVEAWRTFLQRLTPRGIVSFTRWYGLDIPGEVFRLVSVATEALRQEGVTDPYQHIAVVVGGVFQGTIIVGRNPLTETDLDLLDRSYENGRYALLHSPRTTRSKVIQRLIRMGPDDPYFSASPLDFSPTTDDRPFFFNMLRFRAAFRTGFDRAQVFGTVAANQEAVSVLWTLLLVVLALVTLLILLPLALTIRRVDFRGAMSPMAYFAAIGVAFMLVEISQLQRLSTFLGHPTYSLSVVLFSLLLSSGLGSLVTSRLEPATAAKPARVWAVAILVVLGAVGLLSPGILGALRGADMPARIAISVALLVPMGFLMGMALPFGMRMAAFRSETLTPWLWGVNGAASVFSSILAVVISMAAGITATFWTGTACYALATLLLPRFLAPRQQA